MIKKYNNRLKDFDKHEVTLKLACKLNILDFSQAPKGWQIQLIELSKKT